LPTTSLPLPEVKKLLWGVAF